MKAAGLQVPARDLGLPSIRPLAEALIKRLESLEARLAAQNLPVGSPVPPVHLGAERALLSRLESRTADAVTLERQRIRDRTIDELALSVELAPGNVTYVLGGADAVNNNADVMQLPVTAAGVNPMAKRTVKLRDLWPRTRARLTMWYTSPGGSTNAFDLRFQLRHYPDAILTSGATLIFSTQFTPAGPAVANTVLKTTVVGASVLPSLTGPLRFSITRIGADANANALDILLAVVTLEEVA